MLENAQWYYPMKLATGNVLSKCIPHLLIRHLRTVLRYLINEITSHTWFLIVIIICLIIAAVTWWQSQPPSNTIRCLSHIFPHTVSCGRGGFFEWLEHAAEIIAFFISFGCCVAVVGGFVIIRSSIILKGENWRSSVSSSSRMVVIFVEETRVSAHGLKEGVWGEDSLVDNKLTDRVVATPASDIGLVCSVLISTLQYSIVPWKYRHGCQ